MLSNFRELSINSTKHWHAACGLLIWDLGFWMITGVQSLLCYIIRTTVRTYIYIPRFGLLPRTTLAKTLSCV